MKNILITGGAGFIGSNLISKLDRTKYNITVVDNLSPQIHGNNPLSESSLYLSIKDKVNFFESCITDKELMSKLLPSQDIVIHLASETGTGQSMYLIEKYVNVNVRGTSVLLDILANNKTKVKKVILSSSRAVYGEGKYKNNNNDNIYPVNRNPKNLAKGIFDIYLNDEILQLTGTDEEANAYKQFSPDFFDLIVIDECHRGSANEESAWREILTYFKNATHIGLTATPRETKETSNTEYFGEPVYTYSLKQGIDDGFLAPYKVIRIALNVDSEGYRPQKGKTDKDGVEIEDRIYNRKDFDRKLVIDERTDIIAQKVTEYLKGLDRFAKTIIFCVDIDHAERMRNAISRHNADLVAENYKYVMQITGDNDEGKRELDNFINPEEKYPVIATTSELMTTGVDAQTCKVIVLDANINSMTKFKQIVGRGTRINEEFDKLYFTILDFRNATDNFADPDFDGDPLRVKPITQDIDLTEVENEEEEDKTPIIDEVTGAEITLVQPEIRNPFGEPRTEYVARPKQYINGVNVSVLVSRELYFDSNGKPITISLKDHTKEIIKGKYTSLEDFLLSWNHADKKEAIIKELQEQGVMVEALYDAVDKQVDLFDLICHVAYDQPPLTRKERANNVKKRNYFTKYGEQARKVLETLLDKYADEGVENIESIEVLRVKPFDEYGSPIEIISHFGNKQHYMDAVKELEIELYKQA